MRKISFARQLASVALAVSVLAAAAFAEDTGGARLEATPAQEAPERERPPLFTLGFHSTWRVESSFSDSRGRAGYTDSGIWARTGFPLREGVFLLPMLSYQHTRFSWSSNQDFLPRQEPWTDLHLLALNADLRAMLDDEFGLLVGGGVGMSGEDDALGDGVFALARTAVLWNPSEEVSLGLGVQYSTGLRARSVFPYPFIRVSIGDDWEVGSRRGGMRLGYRATDAVSVGGFGAYDAWSWRLGSGGTPRKGYVRLSGARAGADVRIRLAENISVTAETGVDFARRLEAEDRRGRRVATDTLDPAPFLGMGFSVSF